MDCVIGQIDSYSMLRSHFVVVASSVAYYDLFVIDNMVVGDYFSSAVHGLPERDTNIGGSNSLLNSRSSIITGATQATSLEFIRTLAGKI